MKKIIPAAGAILFSLFSQIAWSGNFIGSPHDFREYPWNRSGEICLPCHVMQVTKTLPTPLWDLNPSTETYIMYGTTFPPGKVSVMNSPPDGISKKCLSCHDGIIASDSYGPNTGGPDFGSEMYSMGIIPNKNHPISFIYDTALAAKYDDLYDPSTRLSGVVDGSGTINESSIGLSDNTESSGTIDKQSTGLSDEAESRGTNDNQSISPSDEAESNGTINADMLFSNRMECSSCHDVHNTKAVPDTKLLVKDSAGSALCLTCHDK